MPTLQEMTVGFPATDLLYLRDAYLRREAAKVLRVELDGKRSYVLLDRTIFHPKGGGQPSDRGWLEWETGSATLRKAMGFWDDRGFFVLHYLEGRLPADRVQMRLDWDFRYLLMRRHTAAHLMDHCLQEASGTKSVTLGSWLGDQPYVDYAGSVPKEEDVKLALDLAERYISDDLPLHFAVFSASDVVGLAPPNEERLPRGVSELRVVKIGDFEWIPCGGTHLRSTREIGSIQLKGISGVTGGYRFWFDVADPYA
mgnify:CR=1 FL=1